MKLSLHCLCFMTMHLMISTPLISSHDKSYAYLASQRQQTQSPPPPAPVGAPAQKHHKEFQLKRQDAEKIVNTTDSESEGSSKKHRVQKGSNNRSQLIHSANHSDTEPDSESEEIR